MLIFFQLISRPEAFFIARFLGRLSFWLGGKDRTRIRRNLKFAYGDELTDAQIEAIAKKVMPYLAMNSVDTLRTPLLIKSNNDQIVEVRGRENIERAYAKSRGLKARN